MMFPFQKIPILLPGNPAENQPDKTVMARIQPMDIESYNDGYHFGCLIKFKSGEILMTKYNADQVEHLISEYWRKFNQQMKLKANPSILPFT